MPAPQGLADLVERFARNLDELGRGDEGCKEAELWQEFVNPFFRLLGWDVDNAAGHALRYREVIHEASIAVGAGTKAPDYCFRVGEAKKFFVEAKAPSTDVRDDSSSAYQLRRYGWSAKLPVSVLTNFESLAVYDCRKRPRDSDGSSVARVLVFGFREYADKWDEVAGILSRDAVWRGDLDRFVEKEAGRRGTAEVDAEFLREMETWREELAKAFARANPGLAERDLNTAVQLTIDRIVFLRVAEDRGIEDYGRLLAQTNGAGVYRLLLRLFREADARYNSGLFHFEREAGRATPVDELTPRLDLPDDAARGMVEDLYFPHCPYEFSQMPPELLGQVYEQFLGKVIRLTAGHNAKVEDKPEVRKAGGVYYTPGYIVDCIVEHTVGRLLDGKTPKEAEGLGVVDPACGSGSFLLGAYGFVLKWHLDWYTRHDPERWAKRRGKSPARIARADGDWRLTLAERKRILLANLFGVDIDEQAVEVTKLSLILKVLEDRDAVLEQRRLYPERELPDLGANVRCGNSLIGTDFWQHSQAALDGSGLADEEERYRVNAFDWLSGFPVVFGGGRAGFDAVIGNPPYVRLQTLQGRPRGELDYLKRNYAAAARGNYDAYVVFIERGLGLLSARGRLGFIVPHKFFNAQYGEPLRRLISEGRHLSHVVHFGSEQVFAGATNYTCLLFLDRAGARECRFVKVADLAIWREEGKAPSGAVSARSITSDVWNFAVGDGVRLRRRLDRTCLRLGEVADVYVGVQTSADDVFIMELVAETKHTLRLRSKALGEERTLEKGLLFPIVSGTDVRRYGPLPARQYLLFPYSVSGGSAELIPFEAIERRHPRTAAYLVENRKRLEKRERGRGRGRKWHRFMRSQNMARQKVVKLCVPRLVEHLHAAYDPDGGRFLDNVDVCGVVWKPDRAHLDLRYLLALLNSRLLRWYFPSVSAPFRGGWLSANRQFLSRLPVRLPDPGPREVSARLERLLRLVDRMLCLKRSIERVRAGHGRVVFEREIAAVDRDVDELVYGIYGLTGEEIRIVEEAEPAAEPSDR